MVPIINGFYDFEEGLVKVKDFCFIGGLLEKVIVYKIVNTEEFLKDKHNIETEEVEYLHPKIPHNIESIVFAYKDMSQSMSDFKYNNQCNK
ncbi:hypothetical protein [Mesonia aquimarina]|uniref:hypothetical protein n=1 Tax=Mesonia aquimarina TaxID=1504967 RepID=UPI000EF62AE6|nr:hypothetical protein [Mesonia aquimarina]